MKTDYKQRLALVKSGLPRIVIRRMNNTIKVQIVEYTVSGDKTLAEANSQELIPLGWEIHKGNIPSSYLIGYIAGLKAVKTGIKEGIADFGLHFSQKNSSLYAVLKGVIDAGISVPVGDVFPDETRINGEHIAKYAEILKKDKKKYESHFSAYIKRSINPEDVPAKFKKIKTEIEKKYKITVEA